MKTVQHLTWARCRAFGWQYYPLGILRLLADLAGFAGPVLLDELVMVFPPTLADTVQVTFIESKQESSKKGYLYAGNVLLYRRRTHELQDCCQSVLYWLLS